MKSDGNKSNRETPFEISKARRDPLAASLIRSPAIMTAENAEKNDCLSLARPLYRWAFPEACFVYCPSLRHGGFSAG